MEAAIWGFIGTLVGAIASIGTTLLSARHASALQTSASSLARAELHRAFQRDTLLELQEALHDLMRLIAQGNFEDRLAHRSTGVWGKQPLTAELNEGQRLAHRKFAMLVERVADDALRSDLKALHQSLSETSLASSADQAGAMLQSSSAQAMKTLEHIGNVLRVQY